MKNTQTNGSSIYAQLIPKQNAHYLRNIRYMHISILPRKTIFVDEIAGPNTLSKMFTKRSVAARRQIPRQKPTTSFILYNALRNSPHFVYVSISVGILAHLNTALLPNSHHRQPTSKLLLAQMVLHSLEKSIYHLCFVFCAIRFSKIVAHQLVFPWKVLECRFVHMIPI